MPLLTAKSEIILLIVYVFVTFSPFILIYGIWKIPDTFRGDVPLINALMTASGILFAFTTTIVANQRDWPASLKAMLFCNVATLLYAGHQILNLAVNKGTFIGTIAFVSASFNANTLTALFVSLRLKRR